TGALTGKIAIFQEIATDSMRLPYDPKTQYPLHDEVVDASPYLDNQHQASMPFDASRYARNPQECDTLVIIRSFMVSGVKADVNEYTLYVDTEVVIINARTGRLQHLEYLGKCLADKNAPVRRNWMMRGEAMQYLASLSLDGKPSKTPYESGGQTPVSDADWHGGYVMELWVATGKFGAYNTLVLGDWERNPAPVSQQKMRDFAVRLYDIQGGKIVSSKNYQDVAIENFDPHTLVVKFGAGKATLTGNIQIKTFPGTLTLPGAAPVNFTAEQAGGQACPDCKNTGKINGKPCARCGGIGALVMYNGLLL
ncbi:MAG: hypothetical protein FWF45_08220, partial [Coriobacteriia bacterium]|nr:hypothetical protein [Coriobacteriia bacterium]